MALTDGPERLKYDVTRVVSNYTVQRATSPHYDHLLAVEEECLTSLVERVHDDGRKGEDWPEVERIPMCWTGGMLGTGQLVPCTPDEATEWRVVAWCWAVPR